MELQDLLALTPSPSDLVKEVHKHLREIGQDEAIEQYQPEDHAVLNTGKRPMKKVAKPTGMLNADGTPQLVESMVDVVRIPLALQKLIVGRAATFLTGAPVELIAEPETVQEETLLEIVKKTWKDNKLNYKTRPLAKAMMSEKEVVELWSVVDAPVGYWKELGNGGSNKRMRVTILKYSDGNRFYPVYDRYGDLIAFGRGYTIKEGDRKLEYLDLYTATLTLSYEKQDKEWAFVKAEPNLIGKIPLVYYSQPRSEWQDVQWMIDRLEELISNHGDINDYNGSPILGVTGQIEGFAAKGERGKVMQFSENADAKYITWDHAPESIRMEIENLIDNIYTITQTANITFKEMKGLGALSGIAIKLMFMDAHGKAKDKQDDYFGECIQRRLNLLKAAAIAHVNNSLSVAESLTITPEFGLFMPNNEMEEAQLQQVKTDTLLRASGEKPHISQQLAVELSDFVENAEDELKLIQQQNKEEGLTDLF